MFGRKGVKRVEAIESDEVDAVESEGFSLEELGSAYAVAIEQASGESQTAKASEQDKVQSVDSAEESNREELLEAPDVTETDGVPVTPESVLEAMLFLGSSNNRPIAIDKLLELFRGVTAQELEESVDSLNALYRQHHRAMVIVRASGGYHMQLVPELHLVRDRFYGKVKETQLTQAAIDCLSLVAYQPGVTRDSIEKQWNQPAAGMLSSLVRKGLLRIEKQPSGERSGEESQYYTTDRFLEIIGLESLEDLPSSEDI
jgi:segregation and condensation protein B